METRIKELFEKRQIDIFLAYRDIDGTAYPCAFTLENIKEIGTWRTSDARYPILKMLLAILRADPQKRCGAILRGCEERGLRELVKWGQIDPARVVILGQACSASLAEKCSCPKPFPDILDFGTASPGVKESKSLKALEEMEREGRLSWWLAHFNRCLKCYGCRDVCPVCFCTDCSLEHPSPVAQGVVPPHTSFHLVRAVHMAGRCIDCGLCEETCPARIPLRSLYKEVNSLVKEIFSYETGLPDTRSPFIMLGEEPLTPQHISA